MWGGGGRGGDLGLLHSDWLCGAAPANRREGERQSAESEKLNILPASSPSKKLAAAGFSGLN